MLQIELRNWFIRWMSLCSDGNSRLINCFWAYATDKSVKILFQDLYQHRLFDSFSGLSGIHLQVYWWRKLNKRKNLLPLPCAWLEDILWSNSFYDGSLPWFRCACSARSEKPKEAKRCPLWTPGSKIYQHGILAGVLPFPHSVGWQIFFSGTSLILRSQTPYPPISHY